MNGFGYSEISKENSFAIEEYHKDVVNLLENCSQSLPLFFLAQGLGAGILLSFLIKNQNLKIAGVIICSAMIKCPKAYKTSYLSEVIMNILGENDEVFFYFEKKKKLIF